MDPYFERLVTEYSHRFDEPQASPLDLASHLPGRAAHLRSIAFGLRSVRLDISYVLRQLEYFGSEDMRSYDEDTLCVGLTRATVILEGLLDALVFCQLDAGVEPTRRMSFKTTWLGAADIREHQERIIALRSHAESNRVSYADFWTIADFWKHYIPYHPRSVVFDKPGVVDIQVHLGSGLSGPVVRGLIVPVYNHACSIVEILGCRYGVEDEAQVERVMLA